MPSSRSGRPVAALLLLALSSPVAGAVQDDAAPPPRADLLTLGRGAVPLSVSVSGAGTAAGADMDAALRIVDGRPGGSTVVNRATDETEVEFVYLLPAATTFDRFAVPDVLETPSPSQTFFREVEVHGSAEGPGGPWVLLASGELARHETSGQETELAMEAPVPVRFVRLRLRGGLEMLRDAMFLEFGEIVGNGVQDAPPLSEAFTGQWRGRGVRLRLTQAGPAVTGCYDGGDPLEGTVDGPLLRARGTARSSGVESLFILAVPPDGSVRGVRSTNGAPFRLYEGEGDDGPPLDCPELKEPVLGCGSVIHGIRFDFDSAVLRPESEPVLAALAEGLGSGAAGAVVIEGHTSSEGDEAYNQRLSERRAAAVVADLVARGVAPERLSPAGIGETRPIATNDDENGRSLNRRVEVHCQG